MRAEKDAAFWRDGLGDEVQAVAVVKFKRGRALSASPTGPRVEPDRIAMLILACEPGKHFLGLWVYRQKAHRRRIVKWTVTYWDREGEYCETALQATPLAAMRACRRDLQQAKGRRA